MIKSVEPVGAAGGKGLCPCPGPDGLPPMDARQLLAGATGNAKAGPDLPARRPGRWRGIFDLTGPHVLPPRNSQTNTSRTDRCHGFGEPASYAVDSAAGATATPAHLIAANGHGKEIAVHPVSETMPIPAWRDRRPQSARVQDRAAPACLPLRPRAKRLCRCGLRARYPADGGQRPAKGPSLRG